MNSFATFFAGNGARCQSAQTLSAPAQSAAATEAATPAIAVDTLCKKYGTHWAVDEVNFIVPKGWTVGLLGGNGAGKTTTIAMIMGLVVPTVGRAMVLGHDMATERHKVLKRMNFESPYVALPADACCGVRWRWQPTSRAAASAPI